MWNIQRKHRHHLHWGNLQCAVLGLCVSFCRHSCLTHFVMNTQDMNLYRASSVMRIADIYRSSCCFNYCVSMLCNSVHVEWRCPLQVCWWWRRCRVFLWRQAVETVPATGRWEQQTVICMTLNYYIASVNLFAKQILLHKRFAETSLHTLLTGLQQRTAGQASWIFMTSFLFMGLCVHGCPPLQLAPTEGIYSCWDYRHQLADFRMYSLYLPQ